jgi:hypothetical protein
MKNKRAFGFIAVGLVAGLALGSLGIATAATSKATASTMTTSTTAPSGRGPGGPGGPGGGTQGRGGGGDIAEALAKLSDATVSDIESQRAAGKSYAAIAKTKGVSTDALIAETVKIEAAELAAEVKAGTMTATERTTILSTIEANLTKAVAETGVRGPGGRDEMGRRPGFGGMGDIAEAVAKLTGLTVVEVNTQRAAGNSYEAIAETKSVTVAQVLAETVKIENGELAAGVKDGNLTAAEKTAIETAMEANIKAAITSTDAMRGPGGPGNNGPGAPSSSNDSNSQVAPSSTATDL